MNQQALSTKTFDVVESTCLWQKHLAIVMYALPSQIPASFDREMTRYCSMVSVKPRHPEGPRVVYNFISAEWRNRAIKQLELCGYVPVYRDDLFNDD